MSFFQIVLGFALHDLFEETGKKSHQRKKNRSMQHSYRNRMKYYICKKLKRLLNSVICIINLRIKVYHKKWFMQMTSTFLT